MRGEYLPTGGRCCQRGNYLRVRGEYLVKTGMRFVNLGTTSACAENTAAAGWRGCRGGNYLRVRGEYNSGTDRLFLNKELPPRARRIPVKLLIWWIMVGTTSACAENTFACSARVVSPWNYLRVRGEYVG